MDEREKKKILNRENKAGRRDIPSLTRYAAKSYPIHCCWDESLEYEITPYVIARRCSLCKRLLTARERRWWRRLWGLFFDNV